MQNKEDMGKILENLKSMNVDQRKKYLKQVNLTKKQVCDSIEENKVTIPMKSIVLKTLYKMDDEQFIDFIATKIDLLSLGLLNKFAK